MRIWGLVFATVLAALPARTTRERTTARSQVLVAVSGSARGTYLFPDLGGEVIHVSGADLLAGTFDVGGAWTIVGAPTSVAPSAPYNVQGANGFTVGDYFKHATWAVTGGFIVCTIARFTSPSNGGMPVSDMTPSAGWNLQASGGSALLIQDRGTSTNTSFPGLTAGSHIICAGFDSGAGQWNVQVDGAAGASSTGTTSNPVGNPNDGQIGGSITGDAFTGGTIYEVYVTNRDATAANLTALYTAAVPPGLPLISETAGTILHVTANDLNAGTATAGPVWTKGGTVTLNAAAGTFPRRASVGSFSAGKFFSLAHPTPIDFTGSGPFTATMVIANNAVGDATEPLAVGNVNGADGWAFLNWNSSGGALLFDIQPFSALPFVFPWMTTGPQVVTVGFDGSGNAIAGLNGVAGTPVAAATILAPSVGAYIGANSAVGAGVSFNGQVYELHVSSDACTSASITAIYNAIVAHGAHP